MVWDAKAKILCFTWSASWKTAGILLHYQLWIPWTCAFLSSWFSFLTISQIGLRTASTGSLSKSWWEQAYQKHCTECMFASKFELNIFQKKKLLTFKCFLWVTGSLNNSLCEACVTFCNFISRHFLFLQSFFTWLHCLAWIMFACHTCHC